MSSITFANPWWLAAFVLLAIPLLLLARRRSLAAMGKKQRIATLATRTALLGAIFMALADPAIHRVTGELSVLFLKDVSASISPTTKREADEFVTTALKSKPLNASAGVIAFAGSAKVLEPLSLRPREIASVDPGLDATASDIGRALDFAAAVLPTNGTRRVILLSDGNETRDNALQAATRLAASGVELWTAPLRVDPEPEVLVEQVRVPPRLKTGESFELTARIRSNHETDATVKLYQNQFLIQQQTIRLSSGTTEFKAPNLNAEGGFVTYEVEVTAEEDTKIENNRGTASASLRGEPKVLLVEGEETRGAALAGALRANKIDVEVRSTAGAPRTLEDLQQFDLFFLSDVPALRLSRQQMDLYRHWVQDFGGGFIMLGGENSFGVGGYYRTPIEQMLPVRMEHEDRQDTPGVALLVILDRSGSMTAQVQGQTKMSLANQGAVFAMNALQPKDRFGVLAVDTRAYTVTPLGPLSDKAAAEQKIMTVTGGGGGIYIYTSLAEAMQALRDVEARIKHVILFSDASDAEEKIAGEVSDGSASGGGSALDLASAMLSARITTSVVALGTEQDKDTAFLRQLAERGSGRFYLTSDATTLPQIFSTETMKVAQSSLIEEPFLAVSARPAAATQGIAWDTSPLLLGYNSTKPKPTAEIVLATERGQPLLATWRYGLGQTAAFTSDAKSRWAAEWLEWDGFGKFWSQLARSLMRKTDHESLHLTTTEGDGKLTLLIDAVPPAGMFRNELAVQVAARSADGETALEEALQVAPGRYRAAVPLPPSGTTILSVTSPQLPNGGTVIGHSRSYPREYLHSGLNRELLRKLDAPNRPEPLSPADVFKTSSNAQTSKRSIADWFLITALFLLPLDIWLRRRSW